MLIFRNGNTFPKKPLEEYSFDEIKYIISQCNNITNIIETLQIAAGYRKKIKEFIETHNISTSHFKSRRVVLNNYQSHQSVKYHFMKVNEHKCAICNLGTTWNNKPLTLQLDHINGNHYDNSKENLRLLCPNCHTQTETFASRNFKNKKNLFKHCKECKKQVTKHNSTEYCKECYSKNINKPILSQQICFKEKNILKCYYCSTDITNKSKTGLCTDCAHKHTRKVERPSYDILMKDIENLGYVQTGKKYGVSDNAIRKWVRKYNNLKTKV